MTSVLGSSARFRYVKQISLGGQLRFERERSNDEDNSNGWRHTHIPNVDRYIMALKCRRKQCESLYTVDNSPTAFQYYGHT